ncbi:MAG: hypothetical protein ACOY9J_02770 [Pseudomonadota bacterium]
MLIGRWLPKTYPRNPALLLKRTPGLVAGAFSGKTSAATKAVTNSEPKTSLLGKLFGKPKGE